MDYFACSIGIGPYAFGSSTNLHDYSTYISPFSISMAGSSDLVNGVGHKAQSALSPLNLIKQSAGMAIKATPIGLINTSISLGHISNISNATDRAAGTNSFLKGEAVTVSGVVPRTPFMLAATTSSDTLKGNVNEWIDQPIGWEIGLSNGKGIDVNRSYSMTPDEFKESILKIIRMYLNRSR